MTGIDPAAAVRELFEDVTYRRPCAQIEAAAHRRRRRRRVSIVAVPALAAMAAGGTALLTASEKIWAGNVHCYYKADDGEVPKGTHSPRTTGERPEVLCAREWRQGYAYFAYDPTVDLDDAPFPVPPLTTCAILDGVAIGVFPTDQEDFCTKGVAARKLKLSEVPDEFYEHMDRYVAMRDDATKRIRDAAVASGGSVAKACLDRGEVEAIARDVLADHGYEGWTVTFTHSKHEPPCWMHVNFENDERNVLLYGTRPGVENIWINDAGVFAD
ncbi:MAG TPA: hypothetical protein VG318_03365 [Actinomycetota bacterium]|nr:hypothetical protein [Actinomycetota bacterium]